METSDMKEKVEWEEEVTEIDHVCWGWSLSHWWRILATAKECEMGRERKGSARGRLEVTYLRQGRDLRLPSLSFQSVPSSTVSRPPIRGAGIHPSFLPPNPVQRHEHPPQTRNVCPSQTVWA